MEMNAWGRARLGAALAVMAVVTAAAVTFLPPAFAAGAQPARDLSGIWWGVKYSPKLEIEGGGEIPYNEAGKAQYARIQAGRANGTMTDEARRLCTPDGVVRSLTSPYPFKIVHTPGQTTILHELNRAFRVVLMDKPQEPAEALEIAPYYSGHSVGHWEGDTLVVETAGHNERTFLDATGAPHSFEMKTVERMRKLNNGQLEIVVTITDPLMLTRPITARYLYRPAPEVQIQTDYVCGEPHRDISHIPGVTEARRARAQ